MSYKHSILIGMFVILAALTGLFTYWNLEGILFGMPLSERKLELRTTKTSYMPGETVYAYISFCKNRDIEPVVQWALIDTFLRPYPSREANSNVQGCFKDRIVEVEPLSETLPPDTYYFAGTVKYQLNPIRTFTVQMDTNEFTVLEGEQTP